MVNFLIVNFAKVSVLLEHTHNHAMHHYYTMLRKAIWENIGLGKGTMRKHKLLPSLNGALYKLIKKCKCITLNATK